MTIIQSIVLGLTQGITEFLPISSSAHLSVIPFIFGWQPHSLDFDLILHLATLLVLLFFYRTKLIKIVTDLLGKEKIARDKSLKLTISLILTTIPAIIFGLLAKDFIENLTSALAIIATMMIVMGIVMIMSDYLFEKSTGLYEKLKPQNALLLGVFQALALIRGVSRSGITLIGSRLNGLSREEAAEYTFLAGIPITAASMASLFLDVHKAGFSEHMDVIVVGFLTTLVSGYIAIRFLIGFLKNHGLAAFGIYRILLGLFVFALLLFR